MAPQSVRTSAITRGLSARPRQGILVSHRQPRATATIREDSSVYVLGPQGTVVGISRGKKIVRVSERFPPPITIYFPEWLKRGQSKSFGELQLENIGGNRISIELATDTMPQPVHAPKVEDIHPGNYVERSDVEDFQHGDILPGSVFVLGRPETYGTGDAFAEYVRREILFLNLTQSSHAAGLFELARRIGTHHSPHTPEDRQKVADLLYDLIFTFVPYGQPLHGQTGNVASVGVFTEHGSAECRHRGALFKIMSQLAGQRSRYVRGTIVPYGTSHAWNVVDILDDRSYAYFVDSSLGIRGRLDGDPKLSDVQISGGTILTRKELREFFLPDKHPCMVWRTR